MGTNRPEPIWPSRLVLDAVHTDQLREHGGLTGIRDAIALDTAVSRLRRRWLSDERTDLAALAAAYALEFVRSQPYRDGNTRIALLAMAAFLGLNGHELDAPETDLVAVMLGAASGRLTERDLAAWLRPHLAAAADPREAVR